MKNLQEIILLFFLCLLGNYGMTAQENPPIPVQVEVNTAQFLNFGAFTVGDAGGTVSVDHNGTRTWTGDVTLLNNGTVSPALYDVYANPGTIINITHPASFELTGTSGQKISLEINSYSTGNTFISTQNPTIPNSVYIGGTLILGSSSANGPGNYSGTINITFNQQ
ncbi:DUF4402 domain-containing protein [Gramella jeungdoensis]|uniref:DUF4402 domain-containing protein n=1 Tax=Gramella jeungdoensis TaxID=708091 RepID=A0ABT0Z341_9FLAO|nr:DUF4402 domain-containing protein [Gramella jeungdoensis]MCM8570152.1 DUF4402 domain-containing protein [Gramella jeungdoensis]